MAPHVRSTSLMAARTNMVELSAPRSRSLGEQDFTLSTVLDHFVPRSAPHWRRSQKTITLAEGLPFNRLNPL